MNPPTGYDLALLNEAMDRVRAEAGHLVRAIDAVRTRMVFDPPANPSTMATLGVKAGEHIAALVMDAFALGPMPNGPATQVDAATLAAKVDEVAAFMAAQVGPKPSIAWPAGLVAVRQVLIDRAMSGDRVTEADVLFAVTGVRGLSALIDGLEAAAEACGHAAVQLGAGVETQTGSVSEVVAAAEAARVAARNRIDQALVEGDVFWPTVPPNVVQALVALSDAAIARGAVDADPVGDRSPSLGGREPFFALPRAQIAARGDVLNAILDAVASARKVVADPVADRDPMTDLSFALSELSAAAEAYGKTKGTSEQTAAGKELDSRRAAVRAVWRRITGDRMTAAVDRSLSDMIQSSKLVGEDHWGGRHNLARRSTARGEVKAAARRAIVAARRIGGTP